MADVNKVKMYMKNFGEFYNNQIETRQAAIILSRTQNAIRGEARRCCGHAPGAEPHRHHRHHRLGRT